MDFNLTSSALLNEVLRGLYHDWWTLIIPTKEKYSWAYLYKDWIFRSLQLDRWYQMSITSVNYPSKDYWTGTILLTSWVENTPQWISMFIKSVNDSVNQEPYQHQANKSNYYSSVEKFITSTNNLWCQYISYSK